MIKSTNKNRLAVAINMDRLIIDANTLNNTKSSPVISHLLDRVCVNMCVFAPLGSAKNVGMMQHTHNHPSGDGSVENS